MAIIKLGIPGDSSSVYELIEILDIKGCDGNIIYEIQNHADSGAKGPHPEFINRSKPFYDTFVNPYFVDQWASGNISYAAKIDNVWYLAINTGSNTYLGTGPSSTLYIRNHCFKNEIKILYIESSLEKWMNTLFGEHLQQPNKTEQTERRNISQSYKEINLAIKRCGDGIARIQKTALKLHEPNYRDLFLAAIHSHSNYIVEGEATNRAGRTDLKIYDKELLTPFIYEFKIFKSIKNIQEGLEQITKKYVTVENRYNGLVLINKKNRDLSEILSEIENCLKATTELNIEDTNIDRNEHKIIVSHKHHLDSSVNCILTIFLFDIQE